MGCLEGARHPLENSRLSHARLAAKGSTIIMGGHFQQYLWRASLATNQLRALARRRGRERRTREGQLGR
eukprot:4431804-Prorocentrum_lima.AAC.1